MQGIDAMGVTWHTRRQQLAKVIAHVYNKVCSRPCLATIYYIKTAVRKFNIWIYNMVSSQISMGNISLAKLSTVKKFIMEVFLGKTFSQDLFYKY